MAFTHDTEMALGCAVALVNTAGPTGDTMTDQQALDAFADEWEVTGSRARNDEELQQVRRLRDRLRVIWRQDLDGVVRAINTLLREGKALPQLVRHDNWDYHIHATTAEQPLATRLAVEIAMALSDVVRAGELSRLAACAQPDCDCVLIDLSKNRSKRFCSTTCGNRANVAAYRARRAAGADA